MSKFEINNEDNFMSEGDSFVSLPNNFQGVVNNKRNYLDRVKTGVYVRDEELTIEKILLEHLKADTPSEKIEEVVSALKSLKNKDEDSIYDVLKGFDLKPYLEIGTSLLNLTAALTPFLGNLF
ncbi:hypothetical protein ACOUE2_13020 [Acinetobacter baumannii]|uniref:hypothetical protein n=1 Tax=Acinetobacter baumannii TaxID=470 RepID=UPI00123DB8A3|nr:hypothetical protein [Acinetobacter baumannii]KAA8925976.1 hypothetical protein DLI70_13090 [Acinetobacter baumannii]KAA8945271.1 hypothetical protein DLI72_12920 [Acinetobacter baumannii]MCA4209033.1 hypothetical protein [Acinetobacter baumannii]MCG6599914.1 hypothetical protein [Acinetobacter baumannii]MCG6647576.1 hypothetical protein [Acinetobacter baumannii]